MLLLENKSHYIILAWTFIEFIEIKDHASFT